MQALIQFFFELCLLRKAPQDLSASFALLGMTLVAEVLTGMIQANTMGQSLGLGLLQSLVSVALMLTPLYGALRLLDRLPRFQQTATALLGSGALLGFIAVVPMILMPHTDGKPASGGVAMLLLAVMAWSVLVTGHILRHTFEIRLGQGVFVAVAYYFFAISLMSELFSGT